MQVSAVVITFAHNEDDDPAIVLSEIVDYAVNRGLYEDIGVGKTQTIMSTFIASDEDGIPDWSSVYNKETY